MNCKYLDYRLAQHTPWIALALMNRALPDQHAALEAGYRFYHDADGVDTDTRGQNCLQLLGATLGLKPEARFCDQSAAD